MNQPAMTITEHDGVVFFDYRPNLVMDLDTAKETVRIKELHLGDRSYIAVGDVTNIVSVTREAREYLASPEAVGNIKAAAIIYGNIISSTLVNLFLRINQPNVVTRVFSNREKAIAWIKKHK